MTNISDAMRSGIVGVKIVGKDDNQIINRRNEYSTNTDKTYFGKYIVNKLETTLKRLEEEAKSKECCPSNNLKNETFSAIGSRKVGTINKAYRLEREQFLKSIKDEYDKEEEEDNTINNSTTNNSTINHSTTNNSTTNNSTNEEHFISKQNKSKQNKNTKLISSKNKEYFNLNNKNNNLNKHIVNKQSLLIIFIILVCLIGLILIRKKKRKKMI